MKNINALNDMGITAKIRDELILSLAVEDYSSAPNLDVYKPGNIWIFGENLGNREIYIKLKITADHEGNELALCLSFHPSEFPMKYPLRSQADNTLVR